MNNSKNKYLPKSSSFDINSFPFYWVARLNSQYEHEMDKTLKKIGMDVSRWRVAMLLRIHGELRVSDIAKHALGKIPTITKIVQRMEEEGLVTSQILSTDARVKVVKLTEQGSNNIETILHTTQTLFEQAFENISEEEIKQFNQISQKLFNNIQ